MTAICSVAAQSKFSWILISIVIEIYRKLIRSSPEQFLIDLVQGVSDDDYVVESCIYAYLRLGPLTPNPPPKKVLSSTSNQIRIEIEWNFV